MKGQRLRSRHLVLLQLLTLKISHGEFKQEISSIKLHTSICRDRPTSERRSCVYTDSWTSTEAEPSTYRWKSSIEAAGFFFFCHVVRNMWLQRAWLKTMHWKHFGTARTVYAAVNDDDDVFLHVTKLWFMFVKVSYKCEIIWVSLCTFSADVMGTERRGNRKDGYYSREALWFHCCSCISVAKQVNIIALLQHTGGQGWLKHF